MDDSAEIVTEFEFMRKSRFKNMEKKFSEVTPEALKIIDAAKDTDILSLTLSFNSPVKVLNAEIVNDDKFIEFVF